MKVRNETWLIRGNGVIVTKPKKISYGDLLVIYTETVGFNLQVSSAVLLPFGEPKNQFRISFSNKEATTFPSMLAALPRLALISNITVIEMLAEIGYTASKYSETASQQMLDAVFYATQYEKELNDFEIVWIKI